MSRLRPIPVLLTLLIPIPLIAQTAPTVAERVLAAASIPGLALEARAGGVPPDELEGLLDALADGKVSGPDARLVLAEERRAAAANGAVPGLGAFVRARLAEGLRGQALAEAIGKEHAARGRKGAPPGLSAQDILAEKRAARSQMAKPRGKAERGKAERR